MSEQNNSTSVSNGADAAQPRFNWLEKYPMDRIGLRPEDQVVVIKEIASCFSSVDALDKFVAVNFPNEFGASLRQLLDTNKTVLDNADACFRHAWDKRLMIAFVMSVQDANQSNMLLGLTATHFLPFYRPTEPWIWPWDADGKPVKGSVADPEVKAANAAKNASPPVSLGSAAASATAPVSTTTSAAPSPSPAVPASTAPKAFKVVRALAKLNAEQLRDLGKLITSAFNQHDLDMICHMAIGERLDVVVQNGPLRKVATDLVTHAEEESKLPELLNEILKRRPGRTEIKPFYQKLATEGAIEVEG